MIIKYNVIVFIFEHTKSSNEANIICKRSNYYWYDTFKNNSIGGNWYDNILHIYLPSSMI